MLDGGEGGRREMCVWRGERERDFGAGRGGEGKEGAHSVFDSKMLFERGLCVGSAVDKEAVERGRRRENEKGKEGKALEREAL